MNSYLCDRNCNKCVLLLSTNSRMLTKIFNELDKEFGSGVYSIVQKNCQNLTCCRDCHIDDFTHFKNCKIMEIVNEDTSRT